MDRFDPFVKYADVYGDIINWEKDPMNKPQNQNKYFFSDGKTYYEQICKMLRLMSVFKEAFNQIYSNEDEISEAWENFVNNLSASVVEGSEPDVTLTWTDDSVNFEFTMVPGVPGEQGVGITSISFNSDYTMTITLSDGNTYTSMSLKGETGPQGPQGETGSGLQILDVYATLADLQSAHPAGQPGDAYQVGSAGNYTLYIWSSSQSAWVPAGSLGTVSPSLSNPLMDGTASAGSQNLYSRGDHVHPTDTSRASKEELDALIKTSQSLIDQSFTYRESPAIQDGLARIDKIKGNALAFNQLARYTNYADATVCGLTITNNNNGSFKINGTYNASGDRNMYGYISIIGAIQGHKYLVKSTGSLMGSFVFGSASGERDSTEYIVTASSSGNMETAIRLIDSKAISGQVVNETIWVNIFDLTQMFGAGKEPTVEQFNSLFPLPYYSYQSALLPFKGTGIKTVGKNQLNYDAWKTVQITGGTAVFENNGVTLTATNNDAYTGWREAQGFSAEARVPVKEGKTITLSWENDESIRGEVYIFPNGTTDGLVVVDNLTRKSLSYTPTSGITFVTFRFGVLTAGQTIHYKNIMIRYADADSTYEPYTSSTTDLPTLTYFPNGMKSAGNVYDELLPNKAITRIKQVTITSFQGKSGSTDNNQYYTTIGQSDIKKPTSNNDVCNVSANIGTNGFSYNAAYGDGNIAGVSVNTGGLIIISFGASSSLTTLALANQWVTNNPITVNYELATPTETAVDLDLSFNAYEDGTEQLLPVNGSVPSTSPIIADMTYLSIDDAMEYIIDKLVNVPQNTQQILESLQDDVADLQTDVGALQPAVSSLQTSVGNINTNIGQLSSTVAGHTASISDMQSDITDLNTDMGDLSDTVTDHTSRIGTLESGLSTTNGQVQNLETSVSDLDDTVTAQGTTVTALDNFVSNIANTRNPGYMSSDNSIGITSAFLNMTLAAGQSTWANIPLPTIMAGFIPLFVVGAATGDGSVCLFKIPSTYNQNNIYRVGVKNTSNSEVTTQVSIEILCIKQRQSQ